MYRHNEEYFGFSIDPGPNQADSLHPAHIQIFMGAKGAAETWPHFGPRFTATQLDDLLKVIKRAKDVLENQYTKTETGYRARSLFL